MRMRDFADGTGDTTDASSVALVDGADSVSPFHLPSRLTATIAVSSYLTNSLLVLNR